MREVETGEGPATSGKNLVACSRLSDSGGERKMLERAKKNRVRLGNGQAVTPPPSLPSLVSSLLAPALFARPLPLSESLEQVKILETL